MGSVTAALILTNFSFKAVGLILFHKFLEATQIQNLFTNHFWNSPRLFLMLFIVGINLFIGLINKSGIFYGYYNFFHQKINDKRAAEASSLFLGMLLFIDDYLSVMTNSRVSSMLCQKFKIPRLKISFLITSMAAPLCTLIPISSWSAEILSILSASLDVLKIKTIEPFSLLISSIPYVFFSIFLFIAGWMVIIFRFSFGKVHREEMLENMKTEANDTVPNNVWEFKLLHFLVPVILLVLAIASNMLFFGGFFNQGATFLSALKSNPYPEKSLFLGMFQAMAVIVVGLFAFGLLRLKDFLNAVEEGLSESKDILILLTLSNIFGKLIAELGIGMLLANFFLPILPVSMLSAAIFSITFSTSLLLGSSWASMTIILPMCIPLVVNIANNGYDLFPLLFTAVGAVLSGAVFGSSLSPAGDLGLMNSKGCKVSHFDYLKVQAQYLIPVGLASFISFLIFGQTMNLKFGFLMSFMSGLVFLFLTYFILTQMRCEKIK